MDDAHRRLGPGSARRSRRELVVDGVVVLGAVLVTLVLTADPATTTAPGWLVLLDHVLGALSCFALWWRRRWPVALLLAVVVASTFAVLVSAPTVVALFTVAVHRPMRTTLVLAVLSLTTVPVYLTVRPDPDASMDLLFSLSTAITAGAVGWGLMVRHRRQLITSLRDRADAAATEARLRAEQAQHEAREDLARELHDVLGHRLSLLSVHAGALRYHRDATREEVAQTAEVIRHNAHLALQDLREVVGVLRAPVGELPQPRLGDVTELVEESRDAGMTVHLTADTDLAAAVPDTAGRTAYRVVQEGLTNARKHAPGAPVTVRVAGTAGGDVVAEVRNGPSPIPATVFDGAGRGIAGLTERATLTGGALEQGPTEDGGWRLAVRLPWPA